MRAAAACVVRGFGGGAMCVGWWWQGGGGLGAVVLSGSVVLVGAVLGVLARAGRFGVARCRQCGRSGDAGGPWVDLVRAALE